jgi:protein-S-isoprenylcysteine O-methyltransferase Ste14
MREFRALGTNVEVYRPATALATGGPYRFSRNPMYVGLTLAYAGIGIAANALSVLMLLIPLLALMRYGVIAREEEYLERKFEDAYRRYKVSARRWL